MIIRSMNAMKKMMTVIIMIYSKRTKIEIEILNPFSPIPVLIVSVRLSCRPAQLVASSGERASKRQEVREPAVAWEGGGVRTG